MESGCRCCSILKSDLNSLLVGIDEIESWSENEADELHFSPDLVTTWTTTPPFLSMWGRDDVLKMYEGTG